MWDIGVYLSIRNYLPSLCREHDGEELPAELTRTGKLVYMMNVVVVIIIVIVYTINDISSQWTRTVDVKLHVPRSRYLTIREMERKGKNEIPKQVLIRKKIRPALPTYTLFEYLHYIKEPFDIPFSTTCLRFTACSR